MVNLQVIAYEESQKYKEGKYIVEKSRVIKVCISAERCLSICREETATVTKDDCYFRMESGCDAIGI